MIHASLFSGIGGPEVAAAMLGWENAFHCEINPFGRAVLDYWFPESKSYEDITKTNFKEWRGRIDVLTGGFPCQPFSYAGKRGGREDERYLWPEMLRAIDEIRPTWVVGENVAGLATMVDGGVLTDMGGGSALFEEDKHFHDWLLEQTFTIEKIAKELEGLGYSVQPVLIPAAAVGAPHRRDRIFILAHADADRSNDVRVPGEDAGKSGEERRQERDEIRLAGVAGELRPEVCWDAPDTKCTRLEYGVDCGAEEKVPGEKGERRENSISFKVQCAEANGLRGETTDSVRERLDGEDKSRPSEGGQRNAADSADLGLPGAADAGAEGEIRGEVGQEGDCPQRRLSAAPAGGGRIASHADGAGLQESKQPGRGEDCEGEGAGMDDRTLRPRGHEDFADAYYARLSAALQSGGYDAQERDDARRSAGVLAHDAWAQGTWWDNFPTVSPVHAGNDGLPFRMDGVSLPASMQPRNYRNSDPQRFNFGRWRTEALKAYGNAIVPQVMYRIFQAIEQA